MKTLVALVFSLLPLSAAVAMDQGRATTHTPYDRYMQPVEGVLRHTSGKASAEQTREWLRTAYNFRYEHKTPFQPQEPALTEQRHAGDCKDKALWLCEKMNDDSVRFVIGQMHAKAKLNHAWLSWQSEGKTWILDPTNRVAPVAAETVSSEDYVPLYSYSRGGKFAYGTKSGAPVAQESRGR